jgi:cellulose synthase/poly-beta-1,6-N-acetylglucosamine synthase-like glycosyltransferase
MRISVVVPSYRRSEDLSLCLACLAAQEVAPAETIVVSRAEDSATRTVVAEFPAAGAVNLREEVVDAPGQVEALSAGVKAASGDVVALTDDDAAPRPDWLRRIGEWFARPEIVGVGGRDALEGFEPDRDDLPVGRVSWSGKVTGNHHLGAGTPRDVDVLKGVNMAFRREALEEHGFDPRLRGVGAQVHNDLKLCLALRRSGGRLLYDPQLVVDHRPAERPQGDRRGKADALQQVDAVHNETLALLEFLSPPRRVAFLLWSVLVGRGPAPGLVHALWTTARPGPAGSGQHLVPTLRGRWLGWRAYRGGIRGSQGPAALSGLGRAPAL